MKDTERRSHGGRGGPQRRGTGSSGSALHASVHYCRATGERLYGVVDAARDQELASVARDRPGQKCLFTDDPGSHMADVAPYLVPIDFHPRYPFAGSEYLDLWAEHLGNSAGILLLTKADPAPLWEHLRNLFRVTDEEDHKYFFRFYDPRVLRLYLPTCTANEAQEFFGPLGRILVESETAGEMLTCSVDRSGVIIDSKPLEQAGRSGSGRGRR